MILCQPVKASCFTRWQPPFIVITTTNCVCVGKQWSTWANVTRPSHLYREAHKIKTADIFTINANPTAKKWTAQDACENLEGWKMWPFNKYIFLIKSMRATKNKTLKAEQTISIWHLTEITMTRTQWEQQKAVSKVRTFSVKNRLHVGRSVILQNFQWTTCLYNVFYSICVSSPSSV